MSIRKIVVAAALFSVSFLNVAVADAQTKPVPPNQPVTTVKSPKAPKADKVEVASTGASSSLPVTGDDVVPLVAFGVGSLLVGLLLRARFRPAR